MRRTLLLVALIATARAQAPPPDAADKASIKGIVRDAESGAPIKGAYVHVQGIRYSSADAVPKTDSQGSFQVDGVEPGSVHVSFSGMTDFLSVSKTYAIAPGQNFVAPDVKVHARPIISGTITDQDGEPLSGLEVFLVQREYLLGSVNYKFAGGHARTDDAGHYELPATPGIPFLVLARESRGERTDPQSNDPADVKLRRPVIVPTYFPGADIPEGAQSTVVRAGEKREINLTVRRSPAYCVHGIVVGAAAALEMAIVEQKPAPYAMSGGLSVPPRPGKTGPRGNFRICHLHPGDYWLTAIPDLAASPDARAYSRIPLNIVDRDIELNLDLAPAMQLPGEVVWDGDTPPEHASLNVNLSPVTRPWTFVWEARSEVVRNKVDVPGAFFMKNVLMDDYAVQVTNIPNDAYLKDVVYGGVSVMHRAFQPGNAAGNAALRVVLSGDGGSIHIRTVDAENNPAPDTQVVVFPRRNNSGADLAAALLMARTDQNGSWSSPMLPPGEYYAVATASPLDRSEETVSRLLQIRSKAEQIDVSAGSVAQAVLTPIGLN